MHKGLVMTKSLTVLSEGAAVALAAILLLVFNQSRADAGPGGSQRSSYEAALAAFRTPSAEYSSVPFWVWNDRITRAQIEEQLNDFKKHGIGGLFIHPRPGLVTPYLSEEWFALCRHAVALGKKLGMKIWLYDENSYPSGFAGGHVPSQMPDAGRSGLKMVHAKEIPGGSDGEPIVVLQKSGEGYVDITSELKTKTFGPGEYCIFSVLKQKPSPWFGGFTYVDLMRRDVTEKFLDVTMNAYKRAIGADFGTVVPGVFQDEAEISPASEKGAVVVNYTPALFDRFREKWGYDLRPHLPSLYEATGDWRRVRHNFYSLLLSLFLDNWAKPYYDYCTKNNLKFTGHYWEHSWPRPSGNPDNLAFAAYAHMPGIDILMNQFAMDTHAQFGNARAVKEIRSAANQMGRERTMSETFGAGGWDMTFSDQKRIADWEYALGVNLINQHLSYVTIKGARKRDHPLSFSYHEPWWNNYTMLADYYGRLSVALTSGEQDNRVLVLEPTTTAWMYYAPADNADRLDAIGKRFQDFVNRLESAQLEYDLASENTLGDRARAEGSGLVVGERKYELVVLPPSLENLDASTLAVLGRYLEGGGRILCYGDPPKYVNGIPATKAAGLVATYPKHWITARAEEDVRQIAELCTPYLGFEIRPADTTSLRLLFHHRRSLKDCEIVFLANTNPSEYARGIVTGAAGSCEEWDPFTGGIKIRTHKAEQGKLYTDFSIPPGGSLLLCLRPGADRGVAPRETRWSEIPSSSATVVRRMDPNVLTIDYCDLTVGGKTESDLYFYDAQRKTFQFHGLEKNPWDGGVQFKTEILDKDHFAPGSGFDATFHCAIAEGTDTESITAVIERPDLFRVGVNGHTLEPLRGRWWLDTAFGIYEIGKYLRSGDNTIVVRSSPFTIHTELEPIYLLGNFALQNAPKGFTIVPARALQSGVWTGQGMPFYSGRVVYTKTFTVSPDQLKGAALAVKLGQWKGVVSEVHVNGRKAGSIAFAPFECDVTKYLRPGKNEVAVVVYGSLKNTLGPHHNNPAPGAAWPAQFQQGAKGGYPPGLEYSVVDYGLLEDFVLVQAKAGQ
jgi:hypothetical protein